MDNLNNTINHLHLTVIYRTLHSMTAKYVKGHKEHSPRFTKIHRVIDQGSIHLKKKKGGLCSIPSGLPQ